MISPRLRLKTLGAILICKRPSTVSCVINFTHSTRTMKKRFFLFALSVAAQSVLAIPAHARYVKATVYDSWYSGRTTYCGQTYQHWGISAAHPWLPCGTNVRVSHKGRTLNVKITDRCDCDSIDLSAGAAYKLGVPLDGIGTVHISY